MTKIPIYDNTVPITCTAMSDEVSIRIATVERMRSHLRSIERTDDGLLLHFPNTAEIESEVRQFTVDEKACCQFWGFEVHTDADALSLRWDGPPSVRDVFDELVAFFASDEPLTNFTGLL